MNTIGYVFILLALLIVRAVTKGRSLTDIPGDLGDLVIALVTSDMKEAQDVLGRTGDTNTATPVESVWAGTPGPNSNQLPGDALPNGDLVAFGKRLESMGYKVSEHPAFGGVTKGAHVPNSDHYKGKAIDVNADTGFRHGEKDALDAANTMAKAAGFKTLWQVAGHYDHLHVAVK